MANVNPEVLKQALDHFAEQEAQAEAEIQQSEEKIVELEARIVECHERLKTVELDRDRVMEIMQRYASKGSSAKAAVSPAKEAKPSGKVAPTPSQTTSTTSAKPIKEPPKTQAKPAETKAEDKKSTEAEAESEGDDDTVKNINDALRGLFR